MNVDNRIAELKDDEALQTEMIERKQTGDALGESLKDIVVSRR